MKIIKTIKKKQRGFAMLEVVLAVVIIAIASFGIYKLYDSSSTNSKLNDEEGTVARIQSAATQLSYSTYKQPSLADLYNSGALPANMWVTPAATSTIKGAFDPISYAVSSDNTYSIITAPSIAGSVAAQFCEHLLPLGDVYYNDNSTETKYSATTASFDSSKNYTITIYFPSGIYQPTPKA